MKLQLLFHQMYLQANKVKEQQQAVLLEKIHPILKLSKTSSNILQIDKLIPQPHIKMVHNPNKPIVYLMRENHPEKTINQTLTDMHHKIEDNTLFLLMVKGVERELMTRNLVILREEQKKLKTHPLKQEDQIIC